MRVKPLLLLSGLVGALLVPFAIADSFLLFVINTLLVFAILAVSLDILVGYTGYISLAHATFFGIGGYASAFLVLEYGVSQSVAFLGAILFVALLSALVGLASLRTSGIYFAIVTFAVAIIMELLVGKLQFLGGSTGLAGVPLLEFGGFLFVEFEHYYYLFLVTLVLTLLMKWYFIASKTGRALKAIREDEKLATSVGINTTKYKMQAFVFASTISGAVGVFWAHYQQFIGPETGGFFRSFMLFAMVVIGGRGSMAGPALGAGLVVTVRDFLELFSPAVTNIFFGVLLLIVVIAAPEGFYLLLKEYYLKYSKPVRARLGVGE
jgi:branched-chain amino acid transport system permease protein